MGAFESRLQRLEERAPVRASRTNTEEIELQEEIVSAEMEALFHLKRILVDSSMTHGSQPEVSFGGGTYRCHTRSKTPEELQTDLVRFERAEAALRARLQALRDLTGDDDEAWAARSERIRTKSHSRTTR